MENKEKRRPSAAEAFNKYVNELIRTFRDTGFFRGEELGKFYRCTRVNLKTFNKLKLFEVDRELTIPETERIYIVERGGSYTGALGKDKENVKKDDEKVVESVKEGDVGTDFDSRNDSRNDSPANKRFPNHGNFHKRLSEIVSKAREFIADVFNRRLLYGFNVCYAKDASGNDVFVWFDKAGKADFVLLVNGNKLIEAGVVTNEDEFKQLLYTKTDVRQLFRALFFIKNALAEEQKKNVILSKRIDAIAQILLIE